MTKRIFILIAMSLAALVTFGQDPVAAPNSSLAAGPIISTILYGLIGLVLYVIGYFCFDRIMKLDLRKELVVDQNEALGIMMAGVFIGLAIIITAAMS